MLRVAAAMQWTVGMQPAPEAVYWENMFVQSYVNQQFDHVFVGVVTHLKSQNKS